VTTIRRIVARFLRETEVFYSPQRPDWLWGLPVSYAMDKVAGAWLWLLTSTRIFWRASECAELCLHAPIHLVACCVIKDRDNFTSYIEKSKLKLKNDDDDSKYYNNKPNMIPTNVYVITVAYFKLQTAFCLLKQNKPRGLNPQANYTDRATAACRRS
jgi:hypothetical protein